MLFCQVPRPTAQALISAANDLFDNIVEEGTCNGPLFIHSKNGLPAWGITRG